jgi:hypothetical protein
MVFQAKNAARVEDLRGASIISLLLPRAQFPNLPGLRFPDLIRTLAELLIPLFLIPLMAGPAQAQRYSFHIYGHDSGLDDNTVLALLQDRRGFLWVGTEGGLYRYEGSHFHLIAEADGLSCRAEVRGLIQTRDGALWTLACNKVFRLEDGHFETVISQELSVRSLESLAEDNHGHLLIANGDTLRPSPFTATQPDASKYPPRCCRLLQEAGPFKVSRYGATLYGSVVIIAFAKWMAEF